MNIIFLSAHAICGTSSHRDKRNIVKIANKAISNTCFVTEDKKGYITNLYISQKKFFLTYVLFTIFEIFEIGISCSLRILFFKSNFASN